MNGCTDIKKKERVVQLSPCPLIRHITLYVVAFFFPRSTSNLGANSESEGQTLSQSSPKFYTVVKFEDPLTFASNKSLLIFRWYGLDLDVIFSKIKFCARLCKIYFY